MSPKTLSLWTKGTLLAWAGFWSFFVIASEVTTSAPLLQKLLVCLGGIAFFVGSALIGIRRSHFACNLLFMEGICLVVANLALLHNPPAAKMFVLATLALPPLLIGRLLMCPQDHARFV